MFISRYLNEVKDENKLFIGREITGKYLYIDLNKLDRDFNYFIVIGKFTKYDEKNIRFLPNIDFEWSGIIKDEKKYVNINEGYLTLDNLYIHDLEILLEVESNVNENVTKEAIEKLLSNNTMYIEYKWKVNVNEFKIDSMVLINGGLLK